MTSAQEKKIRQTGCDARFDNLTRNLYSTDASIYQIEPLGVAFPRNARQASAVIRAAADASVPVTPRGAGTSLVGNAIGEGLIVDFSRYNRQITDLDLEKRSVRVGAGVVLDQLNEYVAERLSILQSREIGLRRKIVSDPAHMNMVWSVRKSGLSLLTGCVGAAKPV